MTLFIKLSTLQQTQILNLAKLYKLNISYKRFVLFNIMINLNIHTNIIRLYVIVVNKIKKHV